MEERDTNERYRNNIVSLLILKALIQSCHGDLNMFSKCLIYTFCQLMETQDIELIDQTCETVSSIFFRRMIVYMFFFLLIVYCILYVS